MPNTSASTGLSSCTSASSNANDSGTSWGDEASNLQSQINTFAGDNSTSDTDLASKQATADSKRASTERTSILDKMKEQKSLATATSEYLLAAKSAFTALKPHTHPYTDSQGSDKGKPG